VISYKKSDEYLRRQGVGTGERYEFIESHRDEFPVTTMCDVLDVSTSGYYDWRDREPSQREREDEQLLEDIKTIHRDVGGVYGRPRMTVELNEAYGWNVSQRRVGRLMREHDISGRQPPSKRRTTDSNHDLAVADNLVDQHFEADGSDEVWLADITYVRTDEGWMYLAAILDVDSRKIVGWSMADSLNRQLCLDALQMAIKRRDPEPGLIHHSDRGSQYASKDYQQMLDEFGIECSISRKGNCLDNAPMESFFGTIKTESLNRRKFATKQEARGEIFKYIESFYNRKRRHSALDYQSPVAYEETEQSLAA